jgi:hypothetical protein
MSKLRFLFSLTVIPVLVLSLLPGISWQKDQRKSFMTLNIMSWRPNMEKNGLLRTKSLTRS